MLAWLQFRIDSWWHNAPLPATVTAPTRPKFQKCHQFDHGRWTPLVNQAQTKRHSHQWTGSIDVVSWNVNADAPFPALRMSTLLSVIEEKVNADVIFLQEVSKDALTHLISDPWIQQHWYTSEADHSSLGNQSFATVTLVSRSFLDASSILLGSVWRVPLPSHFTRDALCCDLLMDSSSEHPVLIRLINVHLDSLPIVPSRRPEQIAIASSYLSAAGRGIIAGDFNPVLPEDNAIISRNHLVDAWTHFHPQDPGFTWGVDGDKPFPPNRLDKVATFKLTPSSMRTLLPRTSPRSAIENTLEKRWNGEVEFSDHYGLACRLEWYEDREVSEHGDERV